MSSSNFEQQRKRAKELLKAARGGDAEALERLRRYLPRPTLILAEAQLVVAREAGFESWPRMKRALAPAPALPPLHAACAAGDEAEVRRLLDSGAAVAEPAGAGGWTPLLHLTRSRRGETAARCRIARMLVERGADPNESALDVASHDGRCSAYAGTIRHARDVELARTLLDLGARREDANVVWAAAKDPDVEILRFVLGTRPQEWTLHHALGMRLQLGDPVGVRLLLEAGADPNIGGGWGRAGTHLHHAVLQGLDLELIEMLLDNGARLDMRDRDGGTAFAAAYRLAYDEAADLLRRRGAKDDELRHEDHVLRAAVTGDDQRVRKLVAERHPRWMRTDHQVLSWALHNGRDAGLAALLGAELDPDIADDAGDYPLHIAAGNGLVEAVGRLIAAGAGLVVRDRAGRIPLDRALDGQGPARRKIVTALLDPESGMGSDVPALTAFPCGDADIDEALRQRGAVESEDLDDLFERAAGAVAEGDLETLRTLLEDIPALVHARSKRHHRGTLLHYIGANDIELFRQKTPPNAVAICRLLLEAGSEVDALAGSYGGGPAQTTLALLASSDHPKKAGLSAELIGVLAEFGAKLDGLDDDGLPMATAVSFRIKPSIAGLVEAGARVDNLIFAAAAGRVDLVETMVDESGSATAASVHCRVPWLHMSRDPRVVAEQALVHAAALDNVAVVERLAARGVDVNAVSVARISALHEAAFHGHAATAEVLLERGADPNRRDARFDSTAYGWANESQQFDVCRLMARYHPPDIVDACMLGMEERVRELLEADPAAANAPDGAGVALRTAAYHGHLAVVTLLLAHGADPRLKSINGVTALDHARERNHAEIARTLEDTSGP